MFSILVFLLGACLWVNVSGVIDSLALDVSLLGNHSDVAEVKISRRKCTIKLSEGMGNLVFIPLWLNFLDCAYFCKSLSLSDSNRKISLYSQILQSGHKFLESWWKAAGRDTRASSLRSVSRLLAGPSRPARVDPSKCSVSIIQRPKEVWLYLSYLLYSIRKTEYAYSSYYWTRKDTAIVTVSWSVKYQKYIKRLSPVFKNIKEEINDKHWILLIAEYRLNGTESVPQPSQARLAVSTKENPGPRHISLFLNNQTRPGSVVFSHNFSAGFSTYIAHAGKLNLQSLSGIASGYINDDKAIWNSISGRPAIAPAASLLHCSECSSRLPHPYSSKKRQYLVYLTSSTGHATTRYA